MEAESKLQSATTEPGFSSVATSEKSLPDTASIPAAFSIQRKLSIGAIDDPLEEEADRMAERVMRMPETNWVQRKCAHCEEEEKLQRKPLIDFIQKKSAAGESVISESISSRIASTRGNGQLLNGEEKSFMEDRFGADFSSVRIHTDSEAVQLSRELNAQAFTVGADIYFNSGKYAPGSTEGKQLLAHELTHTIQQGETIRRSPGSPAGGCGLCYGNTRAVGNAAHDIVQQAMMLNYPFILTELQLLPSTGDDNGFLDLAYFHGNHEVTIGEIKPANAQGLLQGDLDLFWYESQLMSLGFRVHRMILPPPLVTLPFPTLAPPSCPQTQQLFIDPPVHGIYTYFCEPDFSVLIRSCDCRRGRRPVPVPVPVPVPAPLPRTATERSRWQQIRQFVEELIESGQDAEEAIRNFLRSHPDLINIVIAAGIAGLIATIGEDIITAGVGILDDLVTIPIFAQMVRIAWQLRGLAAGAAAVGATR
jgi:hypothetical protein